MNRLAVAAPLFLFVSWLPAQTVTPEHSMQDCPMHAQSHAAVVESHGDQAMGFPHDKTVHHFRVLQDGGAIEVVVNDPKDKQNLEAIRSHLSRISGMFAKGDFSTPMFVHDRLPPGVTTMKLMKSAIAYSYQETPLGGSVRLRSTNPVAIAAIHDFLRFQITEHNTGDSLDVAQK